MNAIFYPDYPFETLYIPHILAEVYIEDIYRCLRGKAGLTILDIGANIGLVTMFMRQFARQVYAIEPAHEHFEALTANKEYNHWDNVELFNLAIADRDGEMDLYQCGVNRTGHSLMLDYNSGLPTAKVQTMRLDSFMAANGIEHIDFVKLDVEGAEDMILRSDGFKNVANRIDAIEVEFHYPSCVHLINYMTTIGYEATLYESSAVVGLFKRKGSAL